MEKELIATLKDNLESEKAKIIKELESFATKDDSIKDNWDVKPLNAQDTDMEEKADEVEEYDNLLSVEHSLELKLKDVNAALEKIANGVYGTCEKCSKEIAKARLEVAPEARLCMECNNNR